MGSARARRYARAVFELAQEQNAVEEWGKRIDAVRALLANQEARKVLFNPAIPTVRRIEVIDDLSDSLDREATNLAKLIVSTGRAELVDSIVEEYGALADDAAGRVRATATTAVELESGEQRRLSSQLSESLGKDVRLEVRVDPAILGGMVLQVGDHVVDASVATRLQQLRRRLATA